MRGVVKELSTKTHPIFGEICFVRVRTEERRSLKCNKCKAWRFLKIKEFKALKQGIEINFAKFPVLICPTCKIECLSEKGENELKKFIRLAKSKNTNKLEVPEKYIKDLNKGGFSYKGSLKFDYYYLDSEFIPGLRRFSEGGALIPVFFNKEVLLKYLIDPQYNLYFSSDSYGHIYKGKYELISFGMNRNDRVIFWYCDLYKLPKKEQHYLISENISSDHDIGSDFYIAEIRAECPKLSKERFLEKSRITLNIKFAQKYKFKLYRDGIKNINVIRGVVKPIIWSKKGVKDTIQSLHLLHIESINQKLLKLEIAKLDSSISLDR